MEIFFDLANSGKHIHPCAIWKTGAAAIAVQKEMYEGPSFLQKVLKGFYFYCLNTFTDVECSPGLVVHTP